MTASANLGSLDRIGGCSHFMGCFNMGRTERPCQSPSASPTTTSPSSKGHGVHSVHKTARFIHVIEKRSSYD